MAIAGLDPAPNPKKPDGMSKDDALLDRIQRNSLRAYQQTRRNYEAALEDRVFSEGTGQWPDDVLQDRAGRVTITLNKTGQYVRQITGDVRLNKPSIDVRPAEDGDTATAEVYEGIVREIEDASEAQAVYAMAAEDQVRGGFGYFRIVTEYCDATFDQDIRIRAIRNAHSVVMDDDGDDPTGKDAKFCTVYDDVPRTEYEARWPNASPVSATMPGQDGPATTSVSVLWNASGDNVKVAEYWEVTHEPVLLVQFDDGSVVEDPDDMVFQMAAIAGVQEVRRRNALAKKVQWWITNGKEVLEGPFEWKGNRIPIIRVLGEEVRMGNTATVKGVIRDLKDAQRMENYWASALTESVALAPKAPWLATGKQVSENLAEWQKANTGNPNVLLYTPDEQAENRAPKRIEPARVETAIIQLRAQGIDDMKAITGIYDASLGARSNETSGVAINARKEEADVGTYVYADNLNRAIRECGRVIVSLIPYYYDARQQVRILGKDMTAKIQQVNMPGYPDLTRGRYDVKVTTGPSFSTRREQAAQTMLQFIQAVPAAAPFIGDMIARNSDWPDADEVAERLKMLLEIQIGPQLMQLQAMKQQMAMGMPPGAPAGPPQGALPAPPPG